MSKVILFKRRILEDGEPLTAEAIQQAWNQFLIEQALSKHPETNGITKIQKGDGKMLIKKIIQELDRKIQSSEGKIEKAERISKDMAISYLESYADYLRETDPKLSREGAFAKAMLEYKNVGALAIEIGRAHV